MKQNNWKTAICGLLALSISTAPLAQNTTVGIRSVAKAQSVALNKGSAKQAFTQKSATVVQAGSEDKAQRHSEMLRLQNQIETLKGKGDSESRAQIAALSTQIASISQSLGGDLPCMTEPAAAGGPPSGIGPQLAPTPPASCTATASTFANTTPTAIPSGPAVVTSTIVVSGAGSYLWDVDVLTNLTHTFAGDLDITIQSPSGTIVTLTTDNGGPNDDVFNGTLWDDSAATTVTDAAYANLALQTTLVPEEGLAAFIGEDPNGTWTITISDDATGDSGSLTWSLNLSTFAAPPIMSGFVMFSNSTPLAIAPDVPAVVSSVISASGFTNPICGVRMTTGLQHTFAADLDITLTSPTGTIVTISTDNGAGNDNVFDGTVWTQSANLAGQVPYVTNNGIVTDSEYLNLIAQQQLTPEGSFGRFYGETANGDWTLTVSDDLAGDGGTLNSWSLEFVTCTCIQADLSVSLTQTPTPAFAGATVTVDAALANAGPNPAQDASMTVTLPAGLAISTITPSAGGVCNAVNPVTCSWAGSTPSGGNQTISILAGIVTPYVGVANTTASVSSLTSDPVPANNDTALVLTIQESADVVASMSLTPSTITAGQNATLIGTLTNNGPSAAHNPSLSLPLPPGLTVLSVTPSVGGVCTNVSPITCTWLGDTLNGGLHTVTIELQATTSGSLTMSLTASSETADPNGANNIAANGLNVAARVVPVAPNWMLAMLILMLVGVALRRSRRGSL